MKVTFFRLKGYIKVLNGMGLDEIVIDFSKFKNRIILVQGENGCSKSTIIAALTPNPDTSDSFRTDVFIDGSGNRQIIEYPAEKEIHYFGKDESGNDAYYQILIKSIVDDSRTRRTTKAFISKNGEELNPNGNVTSFKEIRDSVLGIDPTYLDLSAISSENRGIVDMIPSDRRKYMAAYIGSLDTYNNIFKVISKKVTTLKSYMNTLNSKIYELGNETELRLKLMQLETALEDKNKERDEFLKSLAEAEATVKLIDPDNKMQDLYVSISDRLISINSDISETAKFIKSYASSLGIDVNSFDSTSMIANVQLTIDSHNSSISDSKSRISTLMSLNESTLQSIENDRSILNGMRTDSIQDNIEVTVNNLKAEIDSYKNHLTDEDIKIIKSTSIDELNDLREVFDNFTKEIAAAEDLYSEDIFQRAVDESTGIPQKNTLQNTITNLTSAIAVNESKIENLDQKANNMEEDILKLKEFQNMRPTECHIDNCPYISNYVQMMSKVGTEDDLAYLREESIALKKDNRRMIEEIGLITQINEVLIIIDGALAMIMSKKNILRKFDSISYMTNPDNMKKLLKAHYRFPDFKIATDVIEKSYIYQEFEKAREQLTDLESDLKVYRNNKSLEDKLIISIKKGEKDYSNRESEIASLTADINFRSKIVSELNARLEKMNLLSKQLEKSTELEKEKDLLRNEFESVKDKIKLVKEKVDSLNSIRNNISIIEDSIKPLDDMINQVRFDLSNIVQYQNEYKDSADKYDKMLFIRNACSPGNGMGIQSEYIKRYMNDIIIDCNKMLAYMFNGQIQLDVPLIDEKHFSIPFLGPNGIVVPDVSCGSTAQRCMIGLVFSCVAMMKSSNNYNILRLDEIDGGLDQQNRIIFINVLNTILDFMNCEQCIICSHNNEFDTQSTTRLICSHTGIVVDQ